MIKRLKQMWADAELRVWRVLQPCKSEVGAFGVGSIVGVMVGVVVIGTIVVALWDTFVGTDTAVQALVGTDAGTTTLKAMWPIVLVVVGIGVAAGVVMWALRKFGVLN